MSQGGVLALLVAAGLGGGFLIGRALSGRRAFGAYMLWLPVPFVALLIVLAVQVDPTLPAERTQNNIAFGFVLVSMMMALPWLLANLAGHWLGKRSMPDRAQPSAITEPRNHMDSLLPDWSRADNPPVPLPEIGQRLQAMVRLIGIAEDRLPGFGIPVDGQGRCILRDKFDYVYATLEDGQPVAEQSFAVADRLLYAVIGDLSYEDAKARAPSTGDDAIRAEQQAMLGRIDPRWARQFASEHPTAQS